MKSMSIDGGAPIRAKMKEIVQEYSYESDNQPEMSAAQTALPPKALQQAAGAH